MLIESNCCALNQCPDKLGKQQKKCMGICCFLTVALIGTMAVIFLFFWNMKNYSVYDRQKLYSEEEYVPDLVEKGLAMAYSREGQFEATNWDHHFFEFTAYFCGRHFDTTLHSDSERKDAIYEAYIKKYGVDMTIFEKQSYREFNSVNQWFYRTLKRTEPGHKPVRPIDTNEDVVVSPADCRFVAFQQVPTDQKVTI